MPWSEYPFGTVTIPADAGPNDPRMVINAQIPDEIATFTFDGETFTTIACILWYSTADVYRYEALCQIQSSGNYCTIRGGVDGSATTQVGVYELMEWSDSGSGTVCDTLLSNLIAVRGNGSRFRIRSNADLDIRSAGDLRSYTFASAAPEATDGVSMPRGFRLGHNNGAIGPVASTGAEVSVDSTGVAQFDAGRVYRFSCTVQVDSSAAAAAVCSGQVRVRVGAGGLGGATLLQVGVSADQGGTNQTYTGSALWSSLTDQESDFEVTLTGGTAGNPLRVVNSGNQGPLLVTIEDVGNASDAVWSGVPTF